MSKDVKTLKTNQWVMSNGIADIKNTLEEIISRSEKDSDWISELKDKVENINKRPKKKQTIKNQEDNLKELWDTMKYNTCIIQFPE